MEKADISTLEKPDISILVLHARNHGRRAQRGHRWVSVSDQPGHADPAFTLRVYAHAMRDEESDLSFAEFGGTERLYPALGISGDESDSSNPLKTMARREGLKACFQINPRPSGSKPVANPIRNGEIELTTGIGRNRAARSGSGDGRDGPMRPLGWVADERRDRW